MRVEYREFKERSPSGGLQVKRGFIILICEDEEESKLLDRVGNPVTEDTVLGTLKLADGYGEFYLSLPYKTNPPDEPPPERRAEYEPGKGVF